MKVAELRKLPKRQIVDLLLRMAVQNKRLKASVQRLHHLPAHPTVLRHVSRDDDTVPAGWVERHGISIPRADGIFESPGAWVQVKHGTIVRAGLKNESILMHMISLELLDQGAEHHGSLYKDWRAAFLSRLDPSKSGEPGGDNPEAWSKEDRYSKLLHRLDKDMTEAMDGIVASRPKARHLAAFQGNQGVFVEAFMTVANAMRDINREAEEASRRAQPA
ncbi:hypothetical protein R5W24_000496 [Gemmata sp. JC717]|uniref:hypothetical protein n=1 Tax=Gemmata algarum TaxID=2975278 RepID=UPI0021BB6590|nr:hypothetical protein [Gemmata algarum]MDY3551420.1 hypothetical protein [Gemmata algarum]